MEEKKEEPYTILDFIEEMKDQRYAMSSIGMNQWIVDYEDVITAINHLRITIRTMLKDLQESGASNLIAEVTLEELLGEPTKRRASI